LLLEFWVTALNFGQSGLPGCTKESGINPILMTTLMKKSISSSIQRTFSPIFLKAAFISTEFMKTIKADFYALKIDFLHYAKVSTCQFR